MLAAFQSLPHPLSNSSELQAFLAEYFAPAGGELEEVPRSELTTEPTFLTKVSDPVIREFTGKVIDIWPDLTRRYAGPGAGNCSTCANSFIPVNRTFVVAGGRFREPYYWDSYWIIEGLLRTGGSFVQIARNIIENFLDLVETIGFVPNGARVYYLNRSQPPLLTLMVKTYVDYTNDTSLLDRAVPLLLREYTFWTTNRSVEVPAPNGKTYTLHRYAVNNNQPRPESFREDWITANNESYYANSGIIYPVHKPLTDVEKATLYANLASGAESGWDYSSRWLRTPSDAARDVYFPLRSLNVRELVPVDLNSILYQNEIILSEFLHQTGNATGAEHFASLARARSEAMYTLMWNHTHWSYFDYNLTSSSQHIFSPVDDDTTPEEQQGVQSRKHQQVLFTPAQLYPFWTGAAPIHLKNNPLAVLNAFSRVTHLLNLNPGAVPASNYLSGQQWDEPNVWPPLQHILISALLSTPATFGPSDPSYLAVRQLALRLAQRYLDSTFCTWWATGGSTSETPRIEGLSEDKQGVMFEKYSDDKTSVAGGGGEYEVVEGFGWTNGVLIWVVERFGTGFMGELELKRPVCDFQWDEWGGKRPEGRRKRHTALGEKGRIAKGREPRSAVELDKWDAKWVKKFGRGRKVRSNEE